MSNILDKVTRLEIIDHTACESCHGSGRIKIEGLNDTWECPACHGAGMGGRTVVFHNEKKQIKGSLQDDGRTLKIFVDKRKND